MKLRVENSSFVLFTSWFLMTKKEATQFCKITNLMRKTFLLVIWIELLWVQEVSSSVKPGSGTLSVKLIEFENEKGWRGNRKPCDQSWIKGPCLHAFEIKIDVFRGCKNGLVCSSTTQSMEYSGNTVNFGHYLDDGSMKPNPLLVPFIKWTGEFQIEVWVYHKKSSFGDSNSLVDRFKKYVLKLIPGHAINLTLKGLTIKTRLEVQFNVSCDPGLYGPTCMCKPTSLLHVCTAEGNLTCKPGYVESGEDCVPMTTTLETTTGAANTPTQPCTATSTEAEQTTATDTQNLQTQHTRTTIGASTELPQAIKTTNVELDSTTQPKISAGAETVTLLMISNETGSTTTSPASRDKVKTIFTTSELKPTKMVLDYTTSKTIDEKSTSELKASKTTAPEHISSPTETTSTVLQEPTTRSHMGNEVIFTSAKTSDPSKTETSTITLLPTMSLKTSTKFVDLTTMSQDLDTVPQRPMQTSYLPFFKPLPALTTSSSKIATTVPNGTTFALPVVTEANLTKLKSTTEISPDTTEKTTKDTKTISNMNINSSKLSFTTARTTIRNTTARITETKSSRTNQTEHMSGSTESMTAAVREPTTRLTLGVEDNYSIAQKSDPSTTVTSSTVMSASVTLEATEKSLKPTTTSEELVTVPVISTRARYFPSTTQLRLATTAWPKLSTKAPQKPLHTAAVSTAKQAFTFSYYRPTTDRMNSRLSTYLRTISPKSLQSTTTNTKAHTTRGKNKKYSSSMMNTKAQEVTAVYNTAPTTQTTQLKNNEPTKTEQPHSPDSTVDLHFKVTKRNPLSATTKKEQERNSMKPAEVTMSTTSTVQVKGATDGHEGKSPVIAFLFRFRTPLASVGFLLVFAVVIVIVAVKWNCSKRGKGKGDSKVEHYSESTYSPESLRSDQRPTIGPNVVAHIDRNCLLWQHMSKTNNLGPIELPRIKLNTLRDYSKEKRNGRNCRYKDSTM